MMNTVMQVVRTGAVALPQPRAAIAVRVAVPGDLAFIDALQKEHSKAVGWFPRQQLDANIRKGQVLIAEERADEPRPSGSGLGAGCDDGVPLPYSRGSLDPSPLGYCISADRYMKHDDCGIIYQLNVAPGHQRGLIGATLIKAVLDRAPYGCKLFCCWCAQDLEANDFWESLGFVPLAFRTGARRAGAKKEPRIHIFWQRRIRAGDCKTAYWFPSETTGGAVRESRIVLPIPPGTHWSDAKPAVLPGMEEALTALPEGEQAKKRGKERLKGKAKRVEAKPRAISRGGLWFAPVLSAAEAKAQKEADAAAKKAVKAARPQRRNDPKLVAAARELRDRYMEQINEGLRLPPGACGKYEVSRSLEEAPSALKGEAVVIERLDASRDGVAQRKLLDAA